MRPKKHETTGASDLFPARLDQIINMKNELVHLAGKIDWNWLDSEIAPLIATRGAPGSRPGSCSACCCSNTFTACPMMAYASGGFRTPISIECSSAPNGP